MKRTMTPVQIRIWICIWPLPCLSGHPFPRLKNRNTKITCPSQCIKLSLSHTPLTQLCDPCTCNRKRSFQTTSHHVVLASPEVGSSSCLNLSAGITVMHHHAQHKQILTWHTWVNASGQNCQWATAPEGWTSRDKRTGKALTRWDADKGFKVSLGLPRESTATTSSPFLTDFLANF